MPPEDHDESLEQQALDARMAELANEQEAAGSSNPTAGPREGDIANPLTAGATEEPQPEPEETGQNTPKDSPEYFIGEMTADEVLEVLGKAKGLDLDAIETRLQQKLMGRFGEFGRELKQIREAATREWQFDPKVLEPLKELDEGVYEALAKGLQQGLKIQSLDAASVIRPIVGETLEGQISTLSALVHDRTEERLVESFVPNYLDLSEEKDFVPWLKANATPDALQAFIDWDDDKTQGKRNATQLISTYRQYESHKAAEAEKAEAAKQKAEANKDTLRRTAEKGGGAQPPVRERQMSEEEAFERRLKELEKEGIGALYSA